jgi:hypothetical protein
MKRLLNAALMTIAISLNAMAPVFAAETPPAKTPSTTTETPAKLTIQPTPGQPERPILVQQPALSERDRLILERQTQRLIPPQQN